MTADGREKYFKLSQIVKDGRMGILRTGQSVLIAAPTPEITHASRTGDPASLLDGDLLFFGLGDPPSRRSKRPPAAGPPAHGTWLGSCGARIPRPALCSSAIAAGICPAGCQTTKPGVRWPGAGRYRSATDRRVSPLNPGVSLPPGAP